MKSKKLTTIAAAALVCGAACMTTRTLAQNQTSQADTTVPGITHPSVEAKLGLNETGVVLSVPVKDGDPVKKGQLLLQQDDRKVAAELEGVQLEANSDAEIKASEADRDEKKVLEKRTKELFDKGSATPSEMEDADLKVTVGDMQVEVSKLKQAMKKTDVKAAKVRLEQMKILSPVDGFVEHIDVSVGEVTDPRRESPCMTVVQLDPLWVEFYLPVNQSQKLKLGQTMDVKYENDSQWQQAKLIYRSPVAEAAAGMQKLRLELKNPSNTDAGLKMEVKLPPEIASLGAPAVSQAR